MNRDGQIVLIEANTREQSILFYQMSNGKGAFSENMAEILMIYN